MITLPAEAHVGFISFAGQGSPVYCDACDTRLHAADEHTAGEGPGGALLCEDCLPEVWAETMAERALEQQRRDLLGQVYEAEKREEAAAVLASEAHRAGNVASAKVFEARREKWLVVAVLKRAAANGPELVASETQEAAE